MVVAKNNYGSFYDVYEGTRDEVFNALRDDEVHYGKIIEIGRKPSDDSWFAVFHR